LDVNAIDSSGTTALQYAGKYGHRKLAELLVENGAGQPKGYRPSFVPPEELAAAFDNGEATVWQLIRRGWAMKTQSHLLIFDAEEFHTTRPDQPSLTNGCLTPSELKDQNVVAVYSTYHGRPGQPAYIHQIEDSLKRIRYVQSKLDAWKGCRNTAYVGPNESHDFDQLRLFAFQAEFTNPALGHLIQVDGLNILYMGFAPEDLEQYKKDVSELKAKAERCDIAFLPVTNSGEDFEAARYTVEELRPRAIIVTDVSRRLDACLNLAKEIAQWGVSSDTEVFVARHPGDKFRFVRE
jgi:hypothetical protein